MGYYFMKITVIDGEEDEVNKFADKIMDVMFEEADKHDITFNLICGEEDAS